MAKTDQVNVLLVDDQPAKLLAYEVILKELDENLIKAASAREAFEQLLKHDVAILLIDVCMPELDGFQLAAMIREHPRFQRTAIIFVSAIHLTDVDLLRGYEIGAVDYVPVPVIPEVLRAKVKVFAELYRKTKQLEQLNHHLEQRVAERTAELEASNARLIESERARSLALAAGQMGSWNWNVVSGEIAWDDGQYRIFGVDPGSIDLTVDNIRSFIHPDDYEQFRAVIADRGNQKHTFQNEARIIRPTGQVRWCICAGAKTYDVRGRLKQISGVMIDITDLKEAEARHTLLVREIDHRARNVLAVVQSIMRLTKAKTIDSYISKIEGRIRALSTAHALLSESRWEGADLGRLVDEELAPYRQGEIKKCIASGPAVFLQPASAQSMALVLHELATNAAKYGAMSAPLGRVKVTWQLCRDVISLEWEETDGPPAQKPTSKGHGMKVITASVEGQLGGTVRFNWRPTGLHFTMSAPIAGEVPKQGAAQRRPHKPQDQSHLAPVGGGAGRLLLVEDEELVGMMMKDMLNDLGYSVIGPFNRVAEAMQPACKESFQAAILDINVKGELVYDLADAISARDIPILFTTGYGAEAVVERFRHVPVLQKPIDRAALEHMLVARNLSKAWAVS